VREKIEICDDAWYDNVFFKEEAPFYKNFSQE